MKILLIHQYFNTPQSGGPLRSYFVSQALVSAGHEVVVISTHNEAEYRIENVDGAEVHFLPVEYDNRFSFFKRAKAFTSFVIRAVSLSGKFKHFDLAYVISVPLTAGLISMINKVRFKQPYIFEVGDLWPDAPIEMGYVRNYVFKKILFGLEKLIYRNAKSIIALSPPIKLAIERRAPGKQVHMIPNMADCDFYFPEKKNPALEIQFGVGGKFVISSMGAIGVANGLEYFIECANLSRKADLPIHFILCGDGALKETLVKSIKHLGLMNISVLPFTNRDGVRQIMNVTDAVFVSFRNVKILETGSPNKFFDGLAAGKMIINNIGGWIKDEIENNRLGISLNPDNPDDFIQKIKPLLSQPGTITEFQMSSRQLAEEKYSRKRLSEQIAFVVK